MSSSRNCICTCSIHCSTSACPHLEVAKRENDYKVFKECEAESKVGRTGVESDIQEKTVIAQVGK